MLGTLERIYGRVRSALGCGVVVMIDDSGPIQLMQIQRFGSMVRDRVPVLFHFGLSASPPIGSEVALSSIAGDPMSAMVVATGHRTSRPKNLAPGQVTLYDQAGSSITLTNDGNATIRCAGTLTMQLAQLHVVGDIVADGAITAGHGGSDQVTVQHHTHAHGPAPDAGT